METTEQPSAPACYKCDDLGYTKGNEVFNVARCDCPIGAKADMRAEKSSFTVGWGPSIKFDTIMRHESLSAVPKVWDGSIPPIKLAELASTPGTITGMLLDPGPPEYVFGNGMLRISASGMTYNGELIKDAGRAHRAFIATMEGRKLAEPLLQRAYDLIDEARESGQVLTIDLVPLKPLAMGHYEMVADLCPARERAEPIKRDEAAFVMLLHPDPAVECDKALRGTGEARALQDGDAPLIRGELLPLQTMMFPNRRQKAPDHNPIEHKSPKVIWPQPDPKNFTLERRDAFSTLTDEQFDKRKSDRRKREAK